jgi:hypothetical protein
LKTYSGALWGPAKHELLGPTDWLPGFEVVESGEEEGTVGMTWLPRGQNVSDWKEQLQVLRAPHAGIEAIFPDDPAWRERWSKASSEFFRECTSRGYGKDWIAYSFSITRSPRSEERHGLGVTRVSGELQYRLWFERIDAPLTDGELDLWQKRFLEAPLR